MSNASHRVIVLLAAYNGMAFIEEQLQSILKQKCVDVTVFISVDLSSDGTYEWCSDYAQHNHRINVLPYGEKFGGAAPNFYRLIRDVDFSKVDYVALSDQDDIWLEDKLITACKQIEKKSIDGYSSNVRAFWDSGREILINKAQPQRKYDYLFEAAGPGCTYVMRKKPLSEFKQILISEKQQANQVTLHDWFIYAFFRVNGYQWFIDPDYKMRYRQHDGNQIGINKGWKARFKRFTLMRSGWYKQQILNISRLIGVQSSILNSRWDALKNINQTRRKWQDRIWLFFIVLVGMLN